MSASTAPLDDGSKRSTSRNRRPSSRPTTPLRPASRSSLRDAQGWSSTGEGGALSQLPLESFEPAFAELSDSMADLEANFMHLQLMHESLARFSESFASFLYGLNMNAYCVDFPEPSGVEELLLIVVALAAVSRVEQELERTPAEEFAEVV
ncbi:MAG: DASH complex subunit dam1 [Caeruleum heppii]|nr:MAG: DASH complex subunit dam1 [Caeruleum heppii]